jgi:hypothetical protein
MMRHRKPITADQVKDAGMALSLLCFLLGARLRIRWIEWAAMAVLCVDMLWPPVFRPFAVMWFGLAEAIGTAMSRILLSALFYLLVTPVGLLRRAVGADRMLAKQWKRGRASTFVVRDHRYSPEDLDHPY